MSKKAKKYVAIATIILLFSIGFTLFLSGTEETEIWTLLTMKALGLVILYISIELFKGLTGLEDIRKWLEDDANEIN